MDEIDCQILRELQCNARITNSELASRVRLSPSPCWNRLRNLEKQHVIEQYVAIYNQKAFGISDTVMIYINLERHDDKALHDFEEALTKLPEITEAYFLTGDFDYYIKVAIAGTAGYEQFLREKLYKIPGIKEAHTTFILRCLKRTFSVTPNLPAG